MAKYSHVVNQFRSRFFTLRAVWPFPSTVQRIGTCWARYECAKHHHKSQYFLANTQLKYVRSLI